MTFVDEIKVHIAAGHGGNGVVRWRHEKGKDKAGAAGGNGGWGGDVYIKGVRNLHVLSNYRHVKEFRAENGGHGQKHSANGKEGDDLTIELPIGSTVTNTITGKVFNVLEDGKEILILHGGRGGLGNEHFKASTNVRPQESTPGKPGDEADFLIILALVADAGLVGLPNAGKSSLLNTLTNATSKVGSYAFTTLEPHLGSHFGFVLADIPGLIKGASKGKGLGHKFLRHITRTSLIIHCISAENDDVVETYKVVRSELETYNSLLIEKPEIVALTKIDTVTPEELKKKIQALKKISSKVSADVVPVSIHDQETIKELSQKILDKLSK